MGKPVKHANDDVYIGSKSLLKVSFYDFCERSELHCYLLYFHDWIYSALKITLKIDFEICRAAILFLARKFKYMKNRDI